MTKEFESWWFKKSIMYVDIQAEIADKELAWDAWSEGFDEGYEEGYEDCTRKIIKENK